MRQDQEVRRRALIEATLESLAEKGLGAVSVRDVARRAGVTPGLITHHFGTFAALLAAAYAQATARVDAVLDAALAEAGSDPERRMDAFLRASFSPEIVDRSLLAAWIGFWGMVRTDPQAAAIHADNYAAYRKRIEDLLTALAARRGRKVGAKAGAVGLTAMLDGLWLELCLDPNSFTVAEAIQITGAFVDGYIDRAPPV